MALLLAAAMLARALLPAGWMPAAQSDGIRIALCGDAGTVMILGRDGSVHRSQPQPVANHESCPFGLAATAMLAPPPPLAVLPEPLRAEPLPVTLLAPLALVPAPRLRPPGRGPPSFA